MKSRLRQYEILLLRLAENFGEVVPFEDLAVALGYLPEERDPLVMQVSIARRSLPDSVELRTFKGRGYRLAQPRPCEQRRPRTTVCLYCGDLLTEVRGELGAPFRYCREHRSRQFHNLTYRRRRALAEAKS